MNKKFGLVFIILFLCVGCEKILYCENGYELKGEKCVKEIVTLAKQKVSGYYCYTSVYNEQLEGNECAYYVKTPAMVSNGCPTYYISYGSRCKLNYGQRSSKCASDELLFGTICYKEYVKSSGGYYCTIGELVGSQCVQRYSYPALANYKYECESGYKMVDKENGICSKTIYKEPKEK